MQLQKNAIDPTIANPDEMDTNAEYVMAAKTVEQPAVISSVFKYIFIETPKEFFGGILGFFRNFLRHFFHEFKFFISPTLKKPPFDTKEYKEDCKYAFGLSMVIALALIFLIKVSWIPVNHDLTAVYDNDISETFMQFMIFIIFAFAYFAMISISVLTGRLLRKMFKIPVTRQESDILFTYLNNSFFSIAAIIAFLMRCSFMAKDMEGTEIASGILVFYMVIVFVLLLIWSTRFTSLNKISLGRRIGFQIISISLLTVYFTFTCSMITAFLLGV